MAKLVYRTKDGSSFEGKKRVYFTCNPNDFNRYFNNLCEEIFDVQDCAVIFKEDPAGGWDNLDEMEAALADMELFVAPITRRLFSGDDPSVARYYELPFASKSGIPLLGLSFEEGLADIFIKSFENGTFLDLTAFSAVRDSSGEVYYKNRKELLGTFMSSLLSDGHLNQDDVQLAYEKYSGSCEVLEQMGASYMENRKLTEAGNMYNNMMLAADSYFALSNDEQQYYEMLARPYINLGSTAFYKGDIKEAKQHTLDGLDLIDKIEAVGKKPEWSHARAVADELMGDICSAENDIQWAVRWYDESINIREKMLTKISSVQERRAYIYLCNKQGDVHMKILPNSAIEYYAKAMQTCDAICLETNNDTESLRDLSISYEKYGRVNTAIGQLNDAKVMYQRSLDLSLQIFDRAGTMGAARDLSCSYYDMGAVCANMKDLAGAEDYFGQCRNLREQICQQADSKQAQQDLYECYLALSNVLHEEGREDESEEYHRKAVEAAMK